MPALLTRDDLKGLNWAQANALCCFADISYYAKGAHEKDIAAKKTELWDKLPHEGNDERTIPENIWEALKQLKSGGYTRPFRGAADRGASEAATELWM